MKTELITYLIVLAVALALHAFDVQMSFGLVLFLVLLPFLLLAIIPVLVNRADPRVAQKMSMVNQET